MYFEIYDWDNLIKRGHGNDILNTVEWEHELMTVPTLNLTLPIHYKDYLDGREEFKVHIGDKVFWGIVKDIDINKAEETLSVRLDHVVSEWEYRQISVNNAVIDGKVDVVFKGDKVNKNKESDEGITANDFTIDTKNFDKITDKMLIEKANAQAWQLSTGDKVKITKVDKSKLKKQEDDYDVTFSTAKGTSVTVKCQVKGLIEIGGKKSKTNKNVNPKETITARNLTVDISTVGGLTNEYLKKMSKAEAHVFRKRSQDIPITSVTNNIRPEIGKYDLTFKTAKGTTLTVRVKVEQIGSYTPNVSDPSVVDKLSDIYNDMNFAYPGWELDWQDGSGSRTIDYVYSRQNKLEALTKTVELTDDLFWRVGFWNEKKIEIGKFGKQKNFIVSLKPQGKTNIQILTEPTIDYDFDNVINVATVYAEKSDTGMSSMTLREVYESGDYTKEGSMQKKGFPVVILRANVNNERDYTRYIEQYPKLAPNNELEYAVLDEESIKAEAGYLIEGTYSFTDLAPTNTDSKKVTDEQRKKAAKTAYEAAIRKLKQSRRSHSISMTTTWLPVEINVGDKVRLIYDNEIWNLEACTSYYKKILSENDWFYVHRVHYSYPDENTEICEITLVKQIKVEREGDNQ